MRLARLHNDLPAPGKMFTKDEVFGLVEAVKTTSDLFMPVGGEVIETNTSLKDNAELVNTDSFGNGWMIKVRLSDIQEADSLLDAAGYQALVS